LVNSFCVEATTLSPSKWSRWKWSQHTDARSTDAQKPPHPSARTHLDMPQRRCLSCILANEVAQVTRQPAHNSPICEADDRLARVVRKDGPSHSGPRTLSKSKRGGWRGEHKHKDSTNLTPMRRSPSASQPASDIATVCQLNRSRTTALVQRAASDGLAGQLFLTFPLPPLGSAKATCHGKGGTLTGV
jgi:hypothetical protein